MLQVTTIIMVVGAISGPVTLCQLLAMTLALSNAVNVSGAMRRIDSSVTTLSQIVYRMQDATDSGRATADARAVFYTNLVDMGVSAETRWESFAWMISWLESRGVKSWYSTWNALDEGWRRAQDEYIQTNKGLLATNYGGSPEQVLINWIGCYNAGLAWAAQYEEAYLFIRRDADWLDYTVWHTTEFWVLTREGGPVNKIWRVDPRPPDRGGEACPQPTVLWDRAKDAPREPIWKCPVTAVVP